MGRLKRVIRILIALAFAAPAAAQAPPTSPTVEGPAAAVEAAIEVERELLAEDLSRYAELARRRSQAVERSSELYLALDAAVTPPGNWDVSRTTS